MAALVAWMMVMNDSAGGMVIDGSAISFDDVWC
jgi:hypothetical protein